MRVAFHMIGGKHWLGGRNYLANLIRNTAEHFPSEFEAMLFVDDNVDKHDVEVFAQIPSCQVAYCEAFAATNSKSLGHFLSTTFSGRSKHINSALENHGIDVLFENARYYGRDCYAPAIAWLPDFLHRHLPHLFSRRRRWKRELGFRFQTNGSREIMLSSEDSKRDCEQFYPRSKSHLHAIPFAIPFVEQPVDAVKSVCRKYEISEPYLFLPNQFYKHKNHMVVAESIKLLATQGLAPLVVATGNTQVGSDAAVYQRLAEFLDKESLTNRFRTLGMIPYAEMQALLAGASALLNPSLFEGWSTTVEEAKAYGVPLILSDLSVHKEQATDAIFFSRSSAPELAKAIQSHFSTEYTPPSVDLLRAQSEERLARFATNFFELLTLTAQKNQ